MISLKIISIETIENFYKNVGFFFCCFNVMYMCNLFHHIFNICSLFRDAFNKKSFQLEIPIEEKRNMTRLKLIQKITTEFSNGIEKEF